MLPKETTTTLFTNTVFLIGNIANRSVKSRGIDVLFETYGADPQWRSKETIGIIDSREINRAYGWMRGLQKFAPDRMFTIARDVLLALFNNGSIVSADDRRLAHQMITRIETFFGLPSTFAPQRQLDQRVIGASRDLMTGRHYSEAVRATFAALVNAVKEKADRTDLDGDGLMTQAFSPTDPILLLSDNTNEQQGWMNLYRGAVAAIRNPLSHRSEGVMEVDEAAELLGFASFLFRHLDSAVKVK